MARIRNFDSFGAVVPHFYPDKREIWHGEALPRAKVHVYQGNVLPLWGEKPIFGPLSKNNTNMAAGLPVIKKTVANWLFAQTTHVKVCMPGGLWCVVLYFKVY